ncbi:MAG: hypothetical protein AAF992_02185 [Bacteroidota bacterium]|mgnify:CR=1 FL=1
MKVKYSLFILIVAFLSVQCSSSKRLLENGNYYQAVLKATDKLRKSPRNNKAQAALRQAYPLAVEELIENIDQAAGMNAAFRWSAAADNYQLLNNMYDAIRTSPAARKVIAHPQSYHRQYGQVKNKAAQEQYAAGEQAMRENTIEDARIAYRHFQQANQYVTGYKDVRRKLAEAQEAGTLKVVVEPQPVPSRYYQVSGDFFYQQVADFLREYERRNMFIAFYSPQEAERSRLDYPDQVLHLRFEDFVVGQTHTFQKEETVTSEDSVKVGEIEIEVNQREKSRTISRDAESAFASKKKTVKKPVYDKVSATLTTHRIEINSGGILGIAIVDGNNRNLLRDEIRGDHVWFSEWARFQGDKRALNDHQLDLCNLPVATPPPPQQLFVEFTKPLYAQLTDRLNRFYRNY